MAYTNDEKLKEKINKGINEFISGISVDEETVKEENIETKYPYTYEEYEKKVFELFSKSTYSNDSPEEKIRILKVFLKKEDPDFIKDCYADSCYFYDTNQDHFKKYNWSKKQIYDDFLHYPIHNLELILL